MRFNRTILLTLALVLIQTSIVPWLVPYQWSDRLLPNLAFIMTVYVALFGGRHAAFLFGLGFGLLEDLLFYGHLMGSYGFGMALLGYLIGLVSERRPRTLAYTLLAIGVGSYLLDTIVYLVYRLFQLTDVTYGFAVYWQILPTLLLQLIIALVLYLPVRRRLLKSASVSGEENAA
ncbi:rod shape-determining protein MreD [Cohnella thermotolerans]|uniref:rod shape-determining protein MreD n=1 Tax=Cohnella thermotolerans TaxID=329858 RepID=UPI00047B6A04|nr:rod shape-determining protein MreD [Cohnella thermotolerans]